MICEECKKDCKNLKGLHSHVGKTHYPIQDYYHKYHPRRDLLTNNLIEFRNYNQYFNTDFNSKSNLASWCYENKKEVVQEYVIKLLKKRCEEKNTEYIPSHLELKTLFLPSWSGLISIFGNTENAVASLEKNFKLKYDYTSVLDFSNCEPEIRIDTREQNPLPFDNSKVMKLSCGDYCTVGDLYSEVFIERKSLSDFVSTISGGKERFENEIKRAQDLGYYIVVVIEDSFYNALNWKPNKNFKQSVNSKFIFYNVRKIMSEYKNVQFVFADSRQKAMDMIVKIFKLKEQARNVDLEFCKDFDLI